MKRRRLYASCPATNEHGRPVTIPAGTVISGLILAHDGYRFRAYLADRQAVYTSATVPVTIPIV